MWEFAAGCMRNYLILKEKARQFDEDKEIQALLAEIRNSSGDHVEPLGRYSRDKAKKVKELSLDRAELARKPLPYERLDQLTVDILFGVQIEQSASRKDAQDFPAMLNRRKACRDSCSILCDILCYFLLRRLAVVARSY